MFLDTEDSARFVTQLGRSWYPQDLVEFAVLHTERMTCGNIGNKAFKLSEFFTALRPGMRVLSFGGAWSNHLHALAYLCHLRGVESVGVIRTGESTNNLLQQSLQRYGMQLHFVSRQEYRQRDDPNYCQTLCRQLDCTTWLPEGGSDDRAIGGCRKLGQMIESLDFNPATVVVPVGTGGTIAGVIKGVRTDRHVIGVPVVRDDKVHANIARWVGSSSASYRLLPALQPGYGKVNAALLEFIVDCWVQTKIMLEPVYTAKVLMHCLATDFCLSQVVGARVLFVHTGGLLGNYGFIERYRQLSHPRVDEFLAALDAACRHHLS